jgi:predicted nucleic acid-binding protein
VNDLYAESSAILRWLLGHADAGEVQTLLAGAPGVVTSALTSVEVARALQRLASEGLMSVSDRAQVTRAYAAAARHWKIFGVTDEVLARASTSFPNEPVRTLDAIHLATATLFAEHVGPIDVLTTDARIRNNAQALGLTAVPRRRGEDVRT